jgi:hypothetical protein
MRLLFGKLFDWMSNFLTTFGAKAVTGPIKDVSGTAKDVTGVRRDLFEIELAKLKLQQEVSLITKVTLEDIIKYDAKTAELAVRAGELKASKQGSFEMVFGPRLKLERTKVIEPSRGKISKTSLSVDDSEMPLPVDYKGRPYNSYRLRKVTLWRYALATLAVIVVAWGVFAIIRFYR